MGLPNTDIDSQPAGNSILWATDELGVLRPVAGTRDGDYVVLSSGGGGGGSTSMKLAIKEQAVVAGTPANFVIDADIDAAALPDEARMYIRKLDVIPHDGLSPPGSVDTKWRLRIYSNINRQEDHIVYDDNWLTVDTGEQFNATIWPYLNEGGSAEIVCRLDILAGATNATFKIRVYFE